MNLRGWGKMSSQKHLKIATKPDLRELSVDALQGLYETSFECLKASWADIASLANKMNAVQAEIARRAKAASKKRVLPLKKQQAKRGRA